MRSFYTSKLLILLAIFCGWHLGSNAQTVFSYTGGVQTWTVPVGMTNVSIDMQGADGGTDYYSYGPGGQGGRVQCNLSVTPGQVYYIYVGGKGTNGGTALTGYAGGFNGGGNCVYGYGAGGGGGTDIRLGGTALSNRIIVAGAGGGGSYNCGSGQNGGAGGGTLGATGWECGGATTVYGGVGGSQVGGGAANTGYAGGTAGGLGTGGNSSPSTYGGGGGAGYYGGGGGGWGGGGGGSSYPAAAGGQVNSITHTQGYNTNASSTAGNGVVNFLVPTITSTSTSLSFGSNVVGTTSPVQTFSVSGSYLTGAPVTVTAPTGFLVSLTGAPGSFGPSVSPVYTAPTLSPTLVYIEFAPTAYSVYNLVSQFSGGGSLSTLNINLSGTGIFPCSGTPTPGTASVSPATGNTTTTFTLSVAGSSIGGVTYQWESWSYGSAGFSNIYGATNATYSFTGINSNTYYQCIVTCSYSGLSAVTNVTNATYSAATACSGAPSGNSISASSVAGCAPSYASNLYLVSSSGGIISGLANNWQISTTSGTTGFTNIAGATNPYFFETVSGSTVWIRDSITCVASAASSFAPAVQLVLNNPPAAISGFSNICNPSPVAYTSATLGGIWSSSNTGLLFMNSGTGVGSGVAPGAVTISYTMPTGCYSTKAVSVYNGPLPIAGPTSVCPGTTATLTNLLWGGVWSSSNTAAAVIGTSGIVTGIGAGTTNILYTLPAGCSATLPLTVNPNPLPVSGPSSVCHGSTAILGDATTGGVWSSTNTTIATVGSSSGIVNGVAPGSANILYTLPTGCLVTVPYTVNPHPPVISGPSTVCIGQNVNLSDAGIGSWTTSDPSTAVVNTSTGVVTGIAGGHPVITFTLMSTGCWRTQPMTVNILPQVNMVTGGGGYCPAGTGVHIGLNGSLNAVNYTLYDVTSSSVAGTMPGSTSALDFGLFTTVGTYTVMATNSVTGCSSNMAGSANVSVNPLPHAYNVTGGGNYCTGGMGLNITTDGSDMGTTYQLYLAGSPVGSPISGTGHNLNFGLQTASGIYTVMATNVLTLCTNNLAGSATININPVPMAYNINGGGGYCLGTGGADVSLANSATGVEYYLYNGAMVVDSLMGAPGMLDFGNQVAAGTYTISAKDMTNGCVSSMTGSTNVVINPLPANYPVTGGGNYCAGGTGEHVGMGYTVSGTNYQLMIAGTPGPVMPGTNAGIDFGLQLTPGTYSVQATIALTGCTTTMSETVNIGINPVPAIEPLTGGGSYCAGGSGVNISLTSSEAGIGYELYNGGVATGITVPGTGHSISFGNQTAAGVYTAQAYNALNSCMRYMSGSANVSVNPVPAVYNVSGGGSYCSGTGGSAIYLSGSQSGINYQVYDGTTAMGSMVAGGGSGMLNLGNQTVAGVYSVTATNAGTGCTSAMNGDVIVGILPLPASYTVMGGGNMCVGDPGFDITYSLSNSGISYQLWNGTSMVGSPLLGTGSSMDFGYQSAAGTYRIVGTNTTTGCSSNSANSVTINVNSLPTVYTVSSGGTFCAGSAGIDVNLSSSDPSGVTYQLYKSGSPVGSTMRATGSAIDFGYQNLTGTYTVLATSTFGCTSNMASSAIIVANPLPDVYTVTGGGGYCSGGTGAHIGLTGSQTFVNYQVYNTSGPAGGFWAGTGTTLDLGAYTGAGAYTVVATDSINHCQSTMSGSATVYINSSVLPSVAISASSGTTVCNGATSTFTASSVNGGVSPVYQWKVDGSSVGYGATYSYTPANGDVVSVTLTSDALCASPAMVTQAVDMTVNPNMTPTIAVSSASGSTVCPGIEVTYNAAVTYGGTAPGYAWKVNGVGMGGSSSTFSYTPAQGDAVSCGLSSNFTCRTENFVLSNSVVMNVDAPVVPVFNITANPGTTLTSGEYLTLTANLSNLSASDVSYQWSLNGVNLPGETGASLSGSVFGNNDVVCCSIMSHNECGNSVAVQECTTLTVNSNVGVAQVKATANNINVVPNPNTGVFTVKGNLSTAADQEVTIEITNVLGQVVYSNKVLAGNGIISEQILLSNSVSNGVYLLNIHAGTENSVVRFVVEQ